MRNEILNWAVVAGLLVVAVVGVLRKSLVDDLRASAEAWRLERDAIALTAQRLGQDLDRALEENATLRAKTDLTDLREGFDRMTKVLEEIARNVAVLCAPDGRPEP